MKLLLIGKSGQVSWELQRPLAMLGHLVVAGRPDVDLLRPDSVADIVAAAAPDVVVNAAAYTAVDRAESEPDVARAVNADAAGALAALCRARDALLVHYSTDYVFDGTKPGAYVETDETAPLGVYGRTKRDGEAAIIASGCRHLIFRTSWVHAPRGTNFVRTILRLAKEKSSLKVVADQVGAPTSAEMIADATAEAIRLLDAGRASAGLYHLTATGETSWHGLAAHIVTTARAHGAALALDAAAIAPTTTAEYGARAPRPLNSRLDTSQLRREFGIALPAWQSGVERTVSELLEGI